MNIHTANYLVLRARQRRLLTPEGMSEGMIWADNKAPPVSVFVLDCWYDMPSHTKQAGNEAMTEAQLANLVRVWQEMTSANAWVAFIWCGRGQVRPHACTAPLKSDPELGQTSSQFALNIGSALTLWMWILDADRSGGAVSDTFVASRRLAGASL